MARKQPKNHMFFIGTMGLGLAIAMLLDGLYGGQKHPPVKAQTLVVEEVHTETPVQEQQEPETEAVEASAKQVAPAVSEAQQQVSYVDMYRKKKEEEEQKAHRPLIDEINTNAYLGDGTKASRRLYLLQQAYKASREATQIINVRPPPVEEDNSDDSDLDEVLAFLDEEEEGQTETNEKEGEDEEEDEYYRQLSNTNKMGHTRRNKGGRISRRVPITTEDLYGERYNGNGSDSESN